MKSLNDFARRRKEGRKFAQENYSRKGRNRTSRQWLEITDRPEAPLTEIGDFDDSDFFGFCSDFEQNAGLGKLGIRDGLNYKERGLETYGEDTQEWKEAQLR